MWTICLRLLPESESEGAFGREESHFENLPKSKYAPLPWKINDELNGGWNGFDKSKFQKVKDEGYGIQMFYNPKPLMYQYYTLLSEISKVLLMMKWSGAVSTGTVLVKLIKER